MKTKSKISEKERYVVAVTDVVCIHDERYEDRPSGVYLVVAGDREEAAIMAESEMGEEFGAEDGFVATHVFTAQEIKDWAAAIEQRQQQSGAGDQRQPGSTKGRK